jgi:hypothetical protein
VEALAQIDGSERQLLALRSYLRNRDSLDSRWSWSAERIRLYETSPEYRLVESELGRITARFEAANPGYTLYVNSQVRSLDVQIQKWNENPTVAAAARVLAKAAARRAPRDGCAGPEGRQAFDDFVRGWQPVRTPTLAAPGLSKHGQARAFDFQVRRGDLIVAGTDSKSAVSAWDKRGWTEKLRAAVTGASDRFTGPLKIPYEPWHYEYKP